MPTAIHRSVEAAQRVENSCVIARMTSGWAVMGDPQVLPGYCLLLPDPVVPHLNALHDAARTSFLRDMAFLGDAVMAVTSCVRINYEVLGNLEPALHAHVVPRYADEASELRAKPVFFYDWSVAPKFDSIAHGPMLQNIKRALQTTNPAAA
jgi:diadenosine tetraphosphate (Ap4A) HIT family hydrolase